MLWVKWPDNSMFITRTPIFYILLLIEVFRAVQGSEVLEFLLTAESSNWATFEQSEELLEADVGPPKSVCAFIRSSRHSRRARILSYGAAGTFKDIGISDYTLTVEGNNVTKIYDVSLPLEIWRHLCFVDINGDTKMYVDGEEETVVKEDTYLPSRNMSSFFSIGSPPVSEDPGTSISSFIGSVAWVQAWNVTLNDDQIKKLSQCVEELEDLNDITFLSLSQRSGWKVSSDLITRQISHSEICVSNSALAVVVYTGNYEESKFQCGLLRGEFVDEEAVSTSAIDLVNNRSNCVAEDSFVSWLMGYASETYAPEDKCPVLLSNGTVSTKPCLSKIPCSLCVVNFFPKLVLYGDVSHFDRLFYLDLSDGGDIAFEGVSSSRFIPEGHLWTLQSDLHSKTWRTVAPGLPFGRKVWVSENEERILTLTGCTQDKFACDNNDCIPMEQRCNAMEDCSDKSDEVNCKVLFEGDKRTPVSGEPITITYSAFIYNIYDIVAEKPVLEMDFSIFLSWYDSRNVFGNLKWGDRNEFDCNGIWHPDFHFIDGYGMIVEHKNIEVSCTIESMPEEDWKSMDDPYMATKYQGALTPVSYFHEFLVGSPCSFTFYQYPFDSQQCNFSILFSNFGTVFRLASEPEMFEHSVERGNLREYELIDAIVVENSTKEYNGSILMTVNLENFYGYHMSSSFAPTILMFLIAMSTFLFPLENFTDRIMVSLTSLLVLAALFTQTAQSSVKTPYLKLLDIWYTAVILLSTFINVSMTVINLVHNREEQTETWPVKISPASYENVRPGRKRFSAKLLNWAIFSLTLLGSIVFTIVYYFMVVEHIKM